MAEPSDPAAPAGSESAPANSTSALPFSEIGPYRLLEKLGEGGMGDIWLADQSYPIHRRVALKILKPGMDTRQVVARFEAERQALAIMDHPAIAKVFDGGATTTGLPYFAMEYVRGEKITTYCDRHQLSIRERLELFVQLCAGVEHAHQKGVIHRDIKPSNVLVSIQGDRAVPRIIDFGIAKAVGQRLTERTLHTQLGRFVGTPEYMSPEQAELTPLDVDTRSDVYSLGILAYELLAGTLPFDAQRFRESGFDDIRRIIRDDAAPRLSTRIARLGEPAATIAKNRRTQPAKLARQFRGDLDWIVLKALDKDRTRRYQTANALAADIQRHLSHEPVEAGPPSAMYRIGKFARRYRFGVSVGATLVLLVLVFSVVMGVQAQRIAREAARANEAEAAALAETATANAVLEFLSEDLLALAGPTAQASPEVNPNLDLTVRTALDRAAQSVAGRFTDQPLVEAAIRYTIGSTYQDLGLYPDAQRELVLAMDLRERALGEDDPQTLEIAAVLGDVYRLQGNYQDAETVLRRVVDAPASSRGESYSSMAMNNLAITYMRSGKYAQAEDLFLRTIEANGGNRNPATLTERINLGMMYNLRRNYRSAEALLADAAEASRRDQGEEHPATITALNNLALAREGAGRYEEAERLHRQVLDATARVWGNEHPNSLRSRVNLANTLRLRGAYAEAEGLLSEAVEISTRIQGESNLGTLYARHRLVELYRDQKRFTEAEALARHVLELRREALGAEHPDTLAALVSLAEVYRRQSEYGRAEQLFADAGEGLRRTAGELNLDTLEAFSAIGSARLEQRRFSEAETALRTAVAGFEGASVDIWTRFDSMSLLGASLAGQGRYADAEQLLLAGYEGVSRLEDTIPAALREDVVRAGARRILDLYVGWNRPDDARKWRVTLTEE